MRKTRHLEVIPGTGRGHGTREIATLEEAVQASISGGLSVRNLTLAAAIAALWATSACKKTGEGEYEVQKPTVGTTTDTVHTPSVETGTAKDTITVPKVTTEKKEIRVPKVKVTTPDERKP
jgi:hypothetical protein